MEPPPPDPDWNKSRDEQLNAFQGMRELGIISVERKIARTADVPGFAELIPEGTQFSVSMLEDGKLKVELGAWLPKLPSALENSVGKISLEFSPDAPTVSEAGFEGPVSATTRITSSVKYDQIHDPNWTLGVELQAMFAKFKGEIADGKLGKTVEISLVNLFNATRGITTPTDLPSDLIIKVDVERFYNAIVKAAKDELADRQKIRRHVDLLMIRFNPVLLAAAMTNDPSLFAMQAAAADIQQRLAERFPKGVKIQFNDDVLGELTRSELARTRQSELYQFLNRVASAPPAQRGSTVSAFVERLDQISNAITQKPVPIVAISIRMLVQEAGRTQGAPLRPDLVRPGNVGRLVGYRVDNVTDDVILYGTPARTPEAALTLDELSEGVRAAFVQNEVPFCSLDPDPREPAGVQQVRVGGVAINSQFARTMLDADYLMKKINAGIVPVAAKSFRSFAAVLGSGARSEPESDIFDRFWFYPDQLQRGDLQISQDGNTVFFVNRMRVLTEQMALKDDGLIGMGKVDPIAAEVVGSFNAALHEIADQYPDIARLQSLFDVILTSRLWRTMGVRSQWIDRLADLPVAKIETSKYQGFNIKIATASDAGFYLSGGVRMRLGASARLAMPLAQRKVDVIAKATIEGISKQMQLSEVPAATVDRPRQIVFDSATISAAIVRGDLTGAGVSIDRLLSADPLDPEAWCLKAEVELQRARFVSSIESADRALKMSPEDPSTSIRALIDKFTANYMLGNADGALAAIDQELLIAPDSPFVRLARADALSVLGRAGEARTEYRKIQRQFPHSSEAEVRFGVFEITQGNIITGREHLDRASRLSTVNDDDMSVRSAKALGEVGMALLEDAEPHFKEAERIANSILSERSSDPISRLRVLTALAIVAMARNDAAAADRSVENIMRLTPANPTILVSMAEWAFQKKDLPLARKYFERAERIAPQMPLVKSLRDRLNTQ
ncbi:MAG: tetratricopeptide repeat protein [Pyrinomonadaceae bacterium]|nr:tetratricopeptide repeat protein [Pyrinomonadaceae bacterium]